jgi:subtilisin family serine protease
MRPAWSWQFEPDTLQRIGSLGLPVPLTKDWAWGGADGAGVKVAVVDSGIDAAHPWVGRLAGAVAIEHDPHAESGVRLVDGEHADLFGHGTACAGIIRQVAPQAQLYSVRVLGEKLTGKGTVFAAGLRWAIDNGMQVVNLSLSTAKRDYFGLFHELADEAYFRRMMLVSAINNAPVPSYPSQYSSVFSVAAHERADPYRLDYNPSPPVEFGAPGIEVEVAWLGGATVQATGNSFAAAHVTGLITRILSKHPGLTPFHMKTILHALADNTGPSAA